MNVSLQEKYAPKSICFGCGPQNKNGLRVRSFADSTDPQVVRAHWKPETHHEAFPGVLNGGIIGSLLDCHSNWTAAYHLMREQNLDSPPCTVTAEFAVKLLRPTPSQQDLELTARVVESSPDRAVVEAELISGGKVCAKCRGIFVAVREGHPAFHRWG